MHIFIRDTNKELVKVTIDASDIIQLAQFLHLPFPYKVTGVNTNILSCEYLHEMCSSIK